MKKKITGLIVLAMFTVVALAGQVFADPSITYTFTDGTVGRSYSDFIRVDDGYSPYTWTKISGTIPSGLSLAKSGNYLYLRGTPTRAGTYNFTLRVRDSYGDTDTQSFTMTIRGSALSINYTFTSGTVGRSYSDFVTAVGGSSPYTWTKASGTIPPGLSMRRTGNYLYLRGTPTRAGTYNFTLRVRDYYGSTATKSFSITVIRSDPVINYTFTSATVGRSYSDFITVSGGSSPYTWTKASGTIPPGLSMSRSGNYLYLRGTPTRAGTYYFTFRVRDYYGSTATKSFSIRVTGPTINYTFTDGTVGRSYSDFVSVSNGSSPYTWTKTSGTIPPGLSMRRSGSYLYLRGTPTRAGTYNFTLRVRDYYGATASKSFSMTIIRSTPVINYTFTGGTVGRSYSDFITVSNGSSPYTWTKTSGTIPPGLSMRRSGNYLYISGTPTRAGTYYFTLRVRDYYGSTATKSFSMTIIRPSITINYTFAGGTVGRSYSDFVTVSGGSSPYTWTKVSGTIPPGLSMSRTGNYLYLRGTPTRAGTYNFTLRARDYNGTTKTKSFTISIERPSISINYTFTSATLGRSYSDFVTVSGGSSPYTWTKTSGTIPPGLSMSRAGNYLYLSGTPTRAGTYYFTLRVRDYYGYTATKSFSMTTLESSLTINYTLTSGTQDSYYSDFVTVSGGTSPYTWSVYSGSLPSGLRLTYSGSTATISGTPWESGTYSFTLRVRDYHGNTATKYLTIYISPSYSYADYSNNSSRAGDGSVLSQTSLSVDSADVVSVGTGRDEGLVDVKANKPVRFIIGEWVDVEGKKVEVTDVQVFVNGKADEDVDVSDEGKFTLPAERVTGGFSVVVKAQTGTEELVTEELNITALE